MGLIADFAKGFLILTLVIWLFSLSMFLYMRQTMLALLLFAGFVISSCIVGYAAYWKARKK